MELDINIARSCAKRLIQTGFGVNTGQIITTQQFAERIGIDEMTQLVLIASWRAREEHRNFYSVLQEEMTNCGMYKMREVVTDEIEAVEVEKSITTSKEFNQAEYAYRLLGFNLFYRHVVPKYISKSTARRWTNRLFGRRKWEARGSRKIKRKIREALKTGVVRFSQTSTSVYIKNNTEKIRIADHPRPIWESDTTFDILLTN